MAPSNINDSAQLKPGSGIWPAAEYDFSPGRTVQEDLTALSKRHFENCGYAEHPVDKRWDLVAEYFCYYPEFEPGTLEVKAPLRLTLREPRSGRTVETAKLVGESSERPGRILRFIGGSWLEKRALNKSLTEAYTDLYGEVEKSLARSAAMESEIKKTRPYRRGEQEKVRPPSPSRSRRR
jgi:hypothetical protein